jgi:hypothetical protein
MKIKTTALALGLGAALPLAAVTAAQAASASAAAAAAKACTGIVTGNNEASGESYTWHLLKNPHHCKARAQVVYDDILLPIHHCTIADSTTTKVKATQNISFPLAEGAGCIIPPDRATITWWGYQHFTKGHWVTVKKGSRSI